MKKKHKYNILVSANCLSTLNEKGLNNKLVASLYDVDTKEKISDGDNDKFEILDYNFMNVVKNDISLDLFILNEIEESIFQIINNNGYDKSLFNPELFDIASNNKDFKITEYEIGRIYTLAEIYFRILQKPTCFADIVEKIVNYDVKIYK
jgi:hypothetical protein